MENREIARLLRETADLMEIAAADSFRIRSYRRAADAVESSPEALAGVAGAQEGRKQLLTIPGIGRTMAEHIVEMVATGEFRAHRELLEKYRPSMLDLLQIQGLGPKTIALIWDAYQAASVDEVEALARAGRLRTLPRLGAKAEEKILRGIASWRSLSGRFRLDQAGEVAERIRRHFQETPGIGTLDWAGSFRRGRETVADLDLLITGPGLPAAGAPLIERFLQLPRIVEVLARGENKVSVRLHGGLQVDLRLLPPACRGAALQYFTGSKQHNVMLRQRALKQGFTLNEYGLFRLTAAGDAAPAPALPGADEEQIYAALGLDWIPPELREGAGEIEAAAAGRLPKLIERADIRGDLHMHTVASDGRSTIEEMAEAAWARGYGYIAITDHSQALAMANGLDEERALAHLAAIRAAEARFRERPGAEGFRILAGIEVDILADGRLDLADEVLAQLDLVIASVHSRFDQPPEEMTARLLRVVAHPHVHILGHPTGRLLLRREPYRYDLEAVLQACARHGVAAEINASPERLDFNDAHARRCKQLGIPVTINTDAHHTRHLELMQYGLATARRAGLEARDVWNALPLEQLRPRLQKNPAAP